MCEKIGEKRQTHRDLFDLIDMLQFEQKLLEESPDCQGCIEPDSHLWHEIKIEKERRRTLVEDMTTKETAFKCGNGRECYDETHELCMLHRLGHGK